MEQEEFASLVRDALAHLYDLSYLNRHKLNEVLALASLQDAGTLNLHRILLESIEQLRPPERVPSTASAWRPYLALALRYGEEKTTGQVAQELGISLRQLRREHARGLSMLTDLLWQKCTQAGQSLTDVDGEVERLRRFRAEKPASVAETLDSVLVTIARHAQAHGVRLTSTVTPNLPCVAVDRAILRQILLNVFNHMIQVSGQGAIHIEARHRDRAVEINATHDVGSNQYPPDSRDSGRISVAQHLLEACGGYMSISNIRGFSVSMVFPSCSPTVVLVIDDNPEMIQLYRRYVGGSNYEMVGATSGSDGLRLAQELHPSIVVLDVMMPDQDGWEILQNLKNLPATKDTPVIVCSVLKEQELAFSLGAGQFLTKPVSQQKLLSTLAACSAMHSQRT